MEKVKVWMIFRELPFNPRFRYSVIESETMYYLIDHDKDWWRYFLPVLHCVIPEKVMKINMPKPEVNSLLLDKRESEEYAEDGAVGVGFGVLISKTLGPVLIFPIVNAIFTFNLPSFINFIIAFSIIISAIVIRMKMSKPAKQLLEFIGEENLLEARMWIFPASIFQGVKILILIVIAVFVASALFMFLGTEGNLMNLISLPVGFMGVFVLLTTHNLLMHMAKYRIIILN